MMHDAAHTIEFRHVQEQAQAALEEACAKQLEGKSYDVKYQTRWTDVITQSAIDALVRHGAPWYQVKSSNHPQQALSPNFKFMVSCLLLQKGGTRVHSETVVFWDATMDGFCCIKWYQNKSIDR